jgi:hypothetical protein
VRDLLDVDQVLEELADVALSELGWTAAEVLRELACVEQVHLVRGRAELPELQVRRHSVA